MSRAAARPRKGGIQRVCRQPATSAVQAGASILGVIISIFAFFSGLRPLTAARALQVALAVDKLSDVCSPLGVLS